METFGGNRRDRGINLLQTDDGGYAIVGYTSSEGAGQEDVYLVRTDPQGQVLWSNTFGGRGNDNGWAIQEAEEGGFLEGFRDPEDGAFDLSDWLINKRGFLPIPITTNAPIQRRPRLGGSRIIACTLRM